jgi:hypothetical protein
MSQTLQNQITYAKSMNGIVQLSDGAGTTITNGTVVSNDISGNNITTNTFNTTDLTLPRKSTAALNTLLGTTIDLDLLIQNLNYNTSTRGFEIWDDQATGQIFSVDVSNNTVYINTLNGYFAGLNSLQFLSSNLQLLNSNVSFPNSTVSFDSFLPTTTITTGFSNDNFITKGYGDSAYQLAGTGPTLSGSNVWTGTNTFNTNLPTSTLTPTLGTELITKTFADNTYGELATTNTWTQINTFNILPRSNVLATLGSQFITKQFGDNNYGRLSVANTFTLQNTFQNGILPCSGTRTTDIQMGGNNQFQYRQATSENNISIGNNTIQGDSNALGVANNTGKRNIGIGGEVLVNLDAGNDNIFMGFQAGRNCGSTRINGSGIQPQRCIAIGTFSQRGNLYATDSISIGYNSLVNASGPAIGNICIGSNVGNGLTFQSYNVLIGSQCGPYVNDNAVTGIGYQCLGDARGQFNSGVAIGTQAGYSNNGGPGGTFIGTESFYTNTTGQYNTGLGLKAGRGSPANGNYMICIGAFSSASSNNECVFGGSTITDQVFLTLPNKVRLACNQSPTGASISLSFRTNENVLITDASTTSINLPTPDTTGVNLGARFHIIRMVATSNITLNAPSGQTIGLYQPDGTYLTNATFVWTNASGSIDILCIGSSAGGTNWLMLPPSISQGTNSLRCTTTISSPTLNYSIPFGGETTTGYHPYFMDNTNMNYKPSTQTLTTTNQTITGSVVFKKYYKSMVNPTNITTTPFTFPSPGPFYEYNLVDRAANTTIYLPLSSDVEIGTTLRFRRITSTTGAIEIQIQTGSGQAILARGAVGTVSTTTLLTGTTVYGSIVYISSNLWAVME